MELTGFTYFKLNQNFVFYTKKCSSYLFTTKLFISPFLHHILKKVVYIKRQTIIIPKQEKPGDILQISAPKPLYKGSHSIHIVYRGEHGTDLRGFYRTETGNRVNGNDEYALVTQLEPIAARQARLKISYFLGISYF